MNRSASPFASGTQRSYLTVMKPKVFAECLELISVEGRAFISFHNIRDTMARKNHVKMWNNSFGRGRSNDINFWAPAILISDDKKVFP